MEMENVINLTVNGTSVPVQRYGFYEDEARIYGDNHAEDGAMNGDTIVDLVGIKYNPHWVLMPMTRSELRSVFTLLRSATVTIGYNSPIVGVYSGPAIPETSAIALALKDSSKEIFSDVQISFKKVRCDYYE